MKVHAPKDCVVASLLVGDESPVSKGDEICILEGDEEALARTRLEHARSLLRIDEAMLSELQVQRQRRMLQIAVEISDKYIEFADAKYLFEAAALAAATGDELRVKQALAAKQKSRGEHERAQIALETFDFTISQAKQKNTAAMEQLEKESDFVMAMVKRLRIRSPKTGVVHLFVTAGSFVKKGDVIAEIGTARR